MKNHSTAATKTPKLIRC